MQTLPARRRQKDTNTTPHESVGCGSPERRTPANADGRLFTWFGRAINPYGDPWYRFSRVVALLERHTSIPPDAKWLDIGCQIGQFIKFVQARYRIDATGVDNFEAANVREVCRKYFRVDIQEAREVLDDSWRYHFRWVDKGFNLDERFSFISALEVLEHMLDTDAFLEECRTHLQDGGHLVISTPNLNSLRNRVGFPFGAYPNGLEYRMVIHHVRLYNAPILKSHVEEHGFQLVAMVGVNFLPIRFLKHRFISAIDARLANFLPGLCGNIIALFVATPRSGPVHG